MGLSKFNEISNSLTVEMILKEIFIKRKILLELRIKKATDSPVKSHLFKRIRREISQLCFKKYLLLKEYKE